MSNGRKTGSELQKKFAGEKYAFSTTTTTNNNNDHHPAQVKHFIVPHTMKLVILFTCSSLSFQKVQSQGQRCDAVTTGILSSRVDESILSDGRNLHLQGSETRQLRRQVPPSLHLKHRHMYFFVKEVNI